MLYQFPVGTALFIILLDLILIGLTFGATKILNPTFRRASFILIFLFFGSLSLVKLVGSSPGVAASTPNELTLQSDSDIGTFYLARLTEGEYLIFWKESIFSKKGTLKVEMEGIYPDLLRILKKTDGQYKELQPDLTVSGSTYKPIKINVSDSEFVPLSSEGEIAIKYVWMRDVLNYMTNIISVIFLLFFFWLTLKKGANRRYE